VSSAQIVYLLLSILFLFICAFFSAAEIGFIKLQRTRLKHLQEEKAHGADRVARIMENPSRFLSTVLTGVSFAETVVVSLGTIFIVTLVGNEAVGTPIAIVVIALVLLVFAKVIPKTIAAQHPERIALPFSRPIEFISRVFHPLVNVLSWISDKFVHIAHSSTMPGALLSKEELGAVISMGEEEGLVDEASAEMLRTVVKLGERQVKEVMIPRTEAIWIENGATLADFLKLYSEKPAHRYPIYDISFDNVEGMLSARDVLIALANKEINRKSVVTKLSRPIYFVPGSKAVGELFTEMRDEKVHLAVILNEYGGTSGIATIDQLVEHIVGEISEELVAAKKSYEVVGARTYKILGNTKIEDVNEELKLGIPEGDYQTVGGFALHLFGRLPKEGEQIVADELKLLVAEIKENKITRIFITKERKAQSEEEAE
jgi:CBS domain containing-hemolysin-like protein